MRPRSWRWGGLAAATAALALGAAGGATAAPASPQQTAAVPTGFRAQSTTWPAPAVGFVLGAAPCATGTCTAVIATHNGGRTWSAVGAPAAPLAQPGGAGVTSIRFSDALHGWAFGPSLYATTDGGRSWHAQALPGGGHQVLALAADRDAAYLAVTPCALGTPQYECTQPSTLWRTEPGAHAWRSVPVALPVTYGVELSTRGATAYVVGSQDAPTADVVAATTDGITWTTRPSPCDKSQDQVLTAVASADHGRVTALCVGDPGFSKAVKHVFRSADTGRTWVDAGTTPLPGIASELATTPNADTLLVASAADASLLYRAPAGGAWETVLTEADGGAGWADPTFTTATTAFVVHGPAVVPGAPAELLTTNDGGRSWAPVALTG